MTLHRRKFNVLAVATDGDHPVHVPEGWQIAPGDADDARVIGAHPWQTRMMSCANGHYLTNRGHGEGESNVNYVLRGACPHRSDGKFKVYLTPENRKKPGQPLIYRGCARG
jgi:hypothetical protein